MQAAEQKTEQQILSKELKEDKKLKLSNKLKSDSKLDSNSVKEIIANSIRPIKVNSPRDKFNALKEPISYPNNYVFASLVEGIYKDDENLYTGEGGKDLHGEEVYPKLGNWQLLTVGYDRDSVGYDSSIKKRVKSFAGGVLSGTNRPNGYSGAAYWNPDTQQVIIVHSGTKNTGGWDADLCGVFLNEHVAQIDSAITFTDKIISVLKEINDDNKKEGKQIPYIQLFITGHSLGAWLAPITAFSAKYLVKEGDYFVANPKFEETGYHASTVIFDGPGCEEMLRRIQRSIMKRYGPSFINSLDIINYLSVPNVINTCNPQVGEVYRLFINLSQEDKKHLERLKNKGIVGELIESAKNWSVEKHIVVHTAATHKIVSIKGVFDPKTGEVLKDNGNLRIEKVEDWPLLISGNQKEEVRSKTLQSVKWGVKTAEILGKLAAKVIGATVRRTPIGLVIDGIEAIYGIYKSAYWYNELMQELNGFLKLADESNNYRLDKGLTCSGADGREIRYETKYLNEDYKDERSLNAFTQPERKFLEEYKFLERYKEDLQGIVTLEELFDSLKDDKKLISEIMEMLKDCEVENGIVRVRTQNLQEFIPYIKRMLHLFPEMKQKVAGAYYKLPSNIHNKLYQLISSSYLNLIKGSLDFGRDNFGFKAFLEDNNLKILHTVQSCTSLGATRVYKTFNLVRNDYRDEKHHAFLNLDRVFYLGGEIFISFLKKIDYKYLLIIECDEVLNDKDDMLNSKIKGFLKELFKVLKENHNIKVILVTERDSKLSSFVRTCNESSRSYQEKSIEARFNDLTSDSQRKLLEKTVIFQGREVPLSAVINRDGNLDTIIDPETVVELFKNKKIEIGKALPSLGETEGYYIERKLVKKVKVKEEVLEDDNLTDLFAISNINKEELSSLVGGRKVRNFSEEDPNPVRFITLNENAEENVEENFNNLCNRYSDCTIHWLERKNNGDLIWRKSHGKTLSELRRYIENYESDLPDDAYSRNNTSIKMVNVNDISNFDERLIVVAAEPGMGKTTALTRFGTQKADGSSKWLIRMNLVEYKDKLEQEGFSDVDSVVKFLHENNIVSNTLAKKLLESRLKESGNIVLLLDGFDEITSKGQTNVVNLIKKLQETKVEKVLISTRLHLRNELENGLSAVAYTLKPFSREDQKEFLRRFWQRDSGVVQELLDNYINKLLEFISKSIGDKERRFMGIPMQMRMVAEAFQEVTKDPRRLDHPELTFPENFDMIKLYDRFLYAKYRVYFGKRGAENIDLDEDEDWLTTKPTKVHRSLALKVLFPEMEKDFIGNNLPSEKDKQRVNRVGIAQCINDRVVFTHRTFAEYFVAGFLAGRLNKDKGRDKYKVTSKFLARELFESKNEVIKAFLDYRLAKEEIHAAILKKGKLDDVILSEENINVTDNLGRSALHYAAQEGHREIVDILLNNGVDIRKPDELGKTALHYAARYNDGTEVVSCLLENAKDCINKKDKKGHTAVYYAAQQGNWDIVDFLIEEKGASTDGLDAEKLLFHYTYKGSVEGIRKVVEKEKKEGEKEIDVTAIKDSHDNTLLHIAARKGHLTVVEFLLEKGADVSVANNSGKVPISYAAEGNHWNIVESLLRKKAKFNDLSGEQKDLLLDHSAKSAHWDIVKLFMEDNGRDNYFGHLSDQQKVGLLCYTAENERWDIIEFLLKKGTNFNELNNKQQFFLLDHFARNFNWEVVKLFMKDSNKGSYFDELDDQQKVELLCYLIDSGELDIAKFLIKKGTKINSSDSSGKKPISYAAENRHWNIVESLLRKKAKFNDLSGKQKDLLLDHSAKSAHWDIVKLFMKDNGRDNYFGHLVDSQQRVELLCYLIRSKDLDVAEFLIEKGTGVNNFDKHGKKPIHYAAGNGYWNIVELLLRNNAHFNDLENAQKDSLLHYSVQNADWNIVKLFIEDDCRDNYFDKLDDQQRMCCLYHFISVGNLGITKFFIEQLIRKERISSVNVPSNHGETFLHLAAKNDKLDIVQYLVNEKGADITAINTDKKTPKDLATEKNCTSVVEFLEQAQQEKLFNAAKQGNLDIVRSLISQGANVDSRDHNNLTPLHVATYNGHLELVKCLLEKGANVLAKNNHDTVLHLAVSSNKEEIIKLVLDKIKETQRDVSQYIDAKDTEGDTPLMWAAENGRVNAAQILLKYGASIEVKNNDGMTALHWAAQNGHLGVAKLLADNGAIIRAIDNNGRKPIHVAALHGNRNIIKLLLSREVSVDNIDKDGWTPLHYAACSGRSEIVNFLLSSGADIDARGKNGRTALKLTMAVEKVRQEQASNEEIVILGPNSLDHVQIDTDYVTAYMEQMYDRGVEVHQDGLKKSYNTAKELYNEGRYKEALKAFEFVFSFQNRTSSLGPNHPDTLVTHMNIAVVFSKLGKYEDALKILKEVLNIQKGLEDLGPNHRDTLTNHHNIAEVYYKQGKYKDALELYEGVLEKRKEILEANHPDVLITRHHIARVLNNQGEHNRALRMFNDIFELQRRRLGEDHPNTLKTQHNIAFTLYRLNKYQQAFSTIREILEKSREVLGSSHPDHLATHHVAALVLLEFGEHEEALKILKGIVQAQEEILGLDHSDTLATRHDIAYALYLQGKSQKALEIFREVYEKRKEVLGSDHLYTSYTYSFIRSIESKCSIQHYGKQQKAFLDLSKFVSSYISHAEIESVKQGLYLPSFEERGIKINGKCIAITRGLSQALFLQSSKSFLSNLETSAKIYERIAQSKQVSKREEKEAFAFSRLLNNFERQLDSATNSLPSNLMHNKGYRTFDNLSHYIAGVKGDFAIHLVTSNHVVAIYRIGDNYAYFDSNAAFVSGLKSTDQLIEVVEKGVKSASYKVGEKGLLVEYFDVEQANDLLSSEDKQILAKEIKTERQLLAEQDKKLGLIKINGQELSRVQLYDFGTKINIEGSVPLLINADMNLSSKKFQDLIDKKEVSMTAREYLDSLKNGKNMEEVVQATKVIPFIGSKSEIGEAEQARELKFSLKRSIKHLATVFRNSSTTDSATIASTVSLTNTSRSESQSPGTTDETNDRPESYLSGVTVNNQLKRSR
ncbi:ankyrin repeat domain-containing protein [Wolbachia endosymbiont (group A) of Colletes cunicularius]|uniref:ankyrin repeat domain-containing protein n=1 Tax=Wolbachia endosymbiont (group A) of Colletes cunicularius TaxID=3139321 RepID=UPI0035C89839